MTLKDAPYAVLIVIFMVVTFFAGRYSAAVASQAVQVPIVITAAPAETTTSRPVVDHDPGTERVVPAQALPPVITIEALPATSLAKAASKPVDAKPLAAPSATVAVPPMKVELEEDPTAVENPYKRKPAGSRPGL